MSIRPIENCALPSAYQDFSKQIYHMNISQIMRIASNPDISRGEVRVIERTMESILRTVRANDPKPALEPEMNV